MQQLQQLDGNILLWIQNHLRCSLLTDMFTFITHLGDAGMLWIAISIVLLLLPKYRKVGWFLTFALMTSLVINNCLIKNIVARVRPYEVVDGLVRLIPRPVDASFPSGHTASSFAAAMVLLFGFSKKRYGICALVLAGTIAFSRLYVGVHYPSDVLAGMLSGIAIGLFWGMLFRKKYNKAEL